MDFEAVLKSRRSIRRFDSREVSDSIIEALLDLVRHAPSSMNGQPWHFIVVRSAETKSALADIKNRYCPADKKAYSADFVRWAPVLAVVCVDRDRSFGRDLPNGVLATAFLLLSAHFLGLGGVYLSAYNASEPGLRAELAELLALPAHVQPVTIVPLGYPDETPPHKALRPLKDMIHHERF